MKGYKVFKSDWTCRDFQYEVGKTYEEQGEPICCEKGFHFCIKLIDCFSYYRFAPNNKVAEVEALGDVDIGDDKCCTNKIKIIREISWHEVLEMVNAGKGCTGFGNSGSRNSGSYNSGWHNSGSHNSGNCNSGWYNSGSHNSGWHNFCDNSAGFFCTQEPNAIIFNVETNMTISEFKKSKYMKAMKSSDFKLTEWIPYTEEEMTGEEEMTEEEMTEYENKKAIGGYLKEYTRKEAYANWWDGMTEENKKIIMAIPNFNKDIFKEITGIDVDQK